MKMRVVKHVKIIYIFQNACCPMVRIAIFHAVYTALTKHVIEKTAVVCMVVKMGTNVMKVYFFCFQYVTWVFSFHFVYIDSLNLELRLGCLFLTIQINLYIIKITVCHFCRCSKKCKTICFIIGQYTSHSWRDGWRVRDCYNRSSRGFVCYAVCLLVVKK